MNYYSSKHMADSFRTVRKNTITIAEEIPEDKYDFKATPEVMSVREMLAHIAVTPAWAMEVIGKHMTIIDVATFGAYQAQSVARADAMKAKEQVVKALRADGEAFAKFLEGVSDAVLAETVSFTPPIQPATKTRFEMLLAVKEHEMHHRGQLMLVQRLLGMTPALTRSRQAMRAQAAAGAGAAAGA
jgi:uncharacterized damage-inducible protein DinB